MENLFSSHRDPGINCQKADQDLPLPPVAKPVDSHTGMKSRNENGAVEFRF
jgi:hypothetical protein